MSNAGLQASASYPLKVTPGASRAWLTDAFGYNGKMQGEPWKTLPFSNTNLIHVLARSMVGAFRYPGGTIANNWDWVNGREYGSTGDYKLSNLKLAYDQIGFTPSYVVNMLTPSTSTPAQRLTNALNMLANAQSLGLPVPLVELGNEFYLSDTDYVAEFPTGVDYGQRCQTWITAIKAQFPAAKCAVVVTMESRSRLNTWTDEVLSACSNYNALVVHWYAQSAMEPCVVTGNGTAAEQNAQWSAFNATNGVNIMLGQPNQDWNQMKALNNVPTNAEIWVTEFNLKDSNGAVRQTWAHGLFVANQMHAFLQDARITRIMLHNWLSSNKQAMYGESNELGHVLVSHGQGSLSTKPYQFAAPGQVMRLFAEVARGATAMTPLRVEHSPQVVVRGVAPYPAIYGWRFTAGGVHRAIFVNTSGIERDINITGIVLTNTFLRQVTGNPRTFVTGEDASLTRVTSADTPAILRVPAYSITTIGGPSDTVPSGSSPHPPAFSANPIILPGVSAHEFYEQSLTNAAYDPDGDKLTFKKVSGPSWLTVWSNGRLSGTANNSDIGTNQFAVEVSDSAGRTSQTVVHVTVRLGTPPLPSALPPRSFGVVEDTFIYSGAQANVPQTLGEFLDIRSTNNVFSSRMPYLKFHVDELPGIPASVTLNIHSLNVAAAVTVFSNSPNWSATSLTWNSRPGSPGFGIPVSSKTVAPGWNQINLPATIGSPGFYAFSLNESLNALQQFTSSRGTNPPYLTIGFASPPPTNYPPVFNFNPLVRSNAHENVQYTGETLAGAAGDAEGDYLVFFKHSGPEWLRVALDGSLAGTPTSSDRGTNSWTVHVTDGWSTNAATLKIVVEGAPIPEVPPLLSIAAGSPGFVVISWSATTPGWVLQESATLLSTNWIDSAYGTSNPVAVPAALSERFYRLIRR